MKSNLAKAKIENLIKLFGQFKDDSFDFELIARFFKNKDHSTNFQVITDKTCNDLDFEDLFTYLDRTYSSVGQQYLYDKLRTIPQDSGRHKQQEALIKLIMEKPELRATIISNLHKLSNNDAFYIQSLFQEEPVSAPKWYHIVPFLSAINILIIIGIFINPIFLFPYIVLFIASLVIHYYNKRNVSIYLDLLPELIRMNRSAKELFKIDELKKINQSLGKALRYTDSIGFRLSFFNIGSRLESDITALLWGLFEIIKIQLLLEPMLLFSLLKQLRKKKTEIEDIFSFVGQVDVLVSIAALRKELEKYCVPEITENQHSLIAKNVYHPLVENCVPNSIEIDKKSVLITGSNMSGKTTFIRTIAVNAITAMTLNTCFAEEFSLPRMKISSAIRISDDLVNDKSYYFEEVLTIKDMMMESLDHVPNLFFLDEIFKGTNTVERISAGKAVLSWLAKGNNIVFVSTHDMELTDLLKEEYELYHFSEQVNHKNVAFDYKLKEGKNHNRNAIRILEINGYPESVIHEAIDISKKFDNARSVEII
ncbi:MAG: DNA mismatch repair protein MutS [Bacteroidales bacterium]|nr:DNA mismatch repair protein MutS [Bacteroidales bacterium]